MTSDRPWSRQSSGMGRMSGKFGKKQGPRPAAPRHLLVSNIWGRWKGNDASGVMPMKHSVDEIEKKKKKLKTSKELCNIKHNTRRRKRNSPIANWKKFLRSKAKSLPYFFFCFWAETLDSALNVDKSFLDAMVIIFGPQPIRSSNPIQSKKSCGLLLLLA